MAFKYRGEDRQVEDVVKRSKQSGGAYDSYLSPDCTFFKILEGERAIRILPPTWEDTKKWGNGWELQIYLHNNVGPDNSTFLCLDKMKGERCPICEARREAKDEEEANALKPSWRALAWVIDRDNEKAGPMVMGLPITLFRDINARSVDKKTGEVILIDHPEDGYDVLFNREGSSLKTKYTQVEIERDSRPVHKDEKIQDKWLTFIEDHPLPEMLTFFDEDYIEKVLSGKVEKRSRDEEEETRPSRRGRSSEDEVEEKSSRRGRKADPEEPEAEPETTSRRRGRDVEEETPRRGRRSQEEDPPFEEGRTSRRGKAEPAEEEEEKEEKDEPRRGRAGRGEEAAEETTTRRRKSEPEEEEKGDEEDSPTSQAKRSLGRLRNNRR